MSASAAHSDPVVSFWRKRTTVDGPRAARFHGEHDEYDLAAIERAGANAPGTPRVLDLGCGTCVVASALVEHLGWRVHAVDFMAEFLTHAVEHPNLTTEVGDVRTFQNGRAYDLILSLGVINYLMSPQEREAMYRRCANMLRWGGALFVKAQFGVGTEVNVDRYSPELQADYRAVYPELHAEVQRIRELVGRVEVLDPYPTELNRHRDTHFHYLVARR